MESNDEKRPGVSCRRPPTTPRIASRLSPDQHHLKLSGPGRGGSTPAPHRLPRHLSGTRPPPSSQGPSAPATSTPGHGFLAGGAPQELLEQARCLRVWWFPRGWGALADTRLRWECVGLGVAKAGPGRRRQRRASWYKVQRAIAQFYPTRLLLCCGRTALATFLRLGQFASRYRDVS
jgi:hypothetical protein